MIDLVKEFIEFFFVFLMCSFLNMSYIHKY